MKLDHKRTVLVGLAFLSICAFWQMYDNIIPLILTNTFHLDETISGAIMAADNILALFLLPFFGALSDRTSTKIGRRMPFILGGTAAAVILMNLLPLFDNGYANGASTGKLAMFVVTLGLLLVAMGTYRSPAVALMPDVTPKPIRSRANAIINLMGAVGGISYLIVAAVLFGFGVQMNGGPETKTAQFLEDITNCIMKTVKLVTYYAPIGFFGFFASLVATYGPTLIGDYSRTLIIYYVMSFAYMFIFFPIYARFGGGKGGAKIMFSKLFRPAAVSFGTCSSVATIPTNMEVAEESGISKDVTDIVLPLGATMHMDGSCFSCVLKIAFVLGVFGEQLSWSRLPFIVLVAVLSSVGMSGVPGGGYIGEYIICSIFFPTQMELAFPILVAIGNLVDPPATMINSAGDYVVSYIVSRFVEGKDWLQKQLNNA